MTEYISSEGDLQVEELSPHNHYHDTLVVVVELRSSGQKVGAKTLILLISTALNAL